MFEGKVVLVYLIDAPDAFAAGIAILNPQVQDHFDRKFITGTVPEDPDDWTSGLRISVASDQIAHFLDFSDEKEFSEISASASPRIRGSSVQ